MKKFNFKSLVIGLVIGATLFSGTAYAIEGLNVSPNPFPILIDNVQTAIEAYNINGFTYVKLGDIGKVTNTSVKFNEVDRQIEIQKIADDTPITFQNMEAISRNNNLYISLSDIIANKDTLLSMVGVTILSAPTPTPVPTPVPSETPIPLQTQGGETQEGETQSISEPTPTPVSETSSSSAINLENARHEQVLASIQADYNTQINIHTSMEWHTIRSLAENYSRIDSASRTPEMNAYIQEANLWNTIHQNQQNRINEENTLHEQNLANITE
jgi:hypothetical protein